MGILRSARRLFRHRRLMQGVHSSRSQDELRYLTQEFCNSATLNSRMRRAGHLFSFIFSDSRDRAFSVRLLRWIALMEEDAALNEEFRHSWVQLLSELNSVPLFAEAGLPAHPGLLPEMARRLSSRVLPTARADSDAGLLFTSIFSSSRSVERFTNLEPELFLRFVRLLWPPQGFQSALRVQHDLRQSLRLLATRVAGRGVTVAIRERGTTQDVHDSPFYRLIFATEMLVVKTKTAVLPGERMAQFCSGKRRSIAAGRNWITSIARWKTRASAPLSSMTCAALKLRWNGWSCSGAVFAAEDRTFRASSARVATRQLLDTLVRGRLEDTRLTILFRQNLTLLARKTVERTGHSGEHYIASNRSQYWQMWRAAAGGGILTVFTAAIKLKIVGAHLPLFVEGFLVGTDYAVTFVLLQIFHLALATKQPSMTAAALAGIVRENRGVSRWSKISAYAAQISRTQLAAAFGNVLAVCIGGVIFQYIWQWIFNDHFLSLASAEHAYHGMDPLESGTAIFAAFTGVILWVGGMVGGWAENFVVFNRIPEAIIQHPLGYRIGTRNMHRIADWLERNVAAWSNSIVLGYLLGLSPVIARFFGIPLDVRHVTLNTGMVARPPPSLEPARSGRAGFIGRWPE